MRPLLLTHLWRHMLNIQPLNDRVIIRRAPEKDKDPTAPHIELPDKLKERPNQGTVLAIGERVTQVQVGDEVMYGKFAGVEIEVEGEKDLLLLREEEIFARTVKP